MPARLNARSMKRLEGVHPDLVKLVTHAAERSDIAFQITEGVRTAARQKQLVAQGASGTLRSRHLTGHAVDVVAMIGGRVSWEFPLYERIARSFKEASRELKIPVKWGGDWPTLRDGPHFQLTWRAYPAAGAKRPGPDERRRLVVGAHGKLVAELQSRLNLAGARLRVDGDFGPKTVAAVRRFQRRRELVADGIVGPKTWAALTSPPRAALPPRRHARATTAKHTPPHKEH